MGIRALIREFIKEMRETPNGTSPYDTVAEVKRIENGKAWVSIPGGVRETPVDIAGNVSVGDKVQVRAGGGRAWASGNYTDPPEGRKATRDTRKVANSALKKANETSEALVTAEEDFAKQVVEINTDLDNLQDQVDGNITSWFYAYVPTLSNLPASEWVDEGTENVHLGDLFYDTSTGYAYRFMSDGAESPTYSWTRISNVDVVKALADAAKAQDTADSKRRVFISQPTPPYDAGDLWCVGSSGDILTCVTARAQDESFNAADWEKRNKYTDDTKAEAAMTAANGKNKVYRQASAPTGGTYAVGDVWFDSDDDNKIYRWNGSSWDGFTLGDDAIGNLNASHINAGTIDARQVTVSYIDAANITSGYLSADRIEAGSLAISKTSGLQTALDGKAGTGDAAQEEQLIYISKASGTSSVSKNTTWVTSTSDSQNTWTLKRPTYSSSYPVLFVAKQTKKVDGTVSCTTPVKDDTTTVIDGGHITTGTIDAARLNINDIIASGNIIVSGDNISGLNNDIGFITSDGVIFKNLVANGFWSPDFGASHPSWSKEASASMEYDESTGLWKISCSSLYCGLTQAVSVEKNTNYVISAEVGATFNLGFGSGSYPQYSGTWETAADGRKYRVVNSGNNNSLTVYAYATSSNPCYINRIKVEKGDTYTGWIADTEEIEYAAGVAGNFLTKISGYTGVSVHDAGDLTNFANMNSTGFTVYENLVDVAHLGSGFRIGRRSNTSVHVEVTDMGAGDLGLFLTHNNSQIGGIVAGQVPTANTNMTRLLFLGGGANGQAEFVVDDDEASMTYKHIYNNTTYKGRMAVYKGSGNTDKGYAYIDTDNVQVTSAGNMTLSGKITAKNIDCGDVTISPTANTPTSGDVTFNKTFSTTPIVVVTPSSKVPGTIVLGVGAESITTTGFKAWVTRTNTTDTTLHWIAIGA